MCRVVAVKTSLKQDCIKLTYPLKELNWTMILGNPENCLIRLHFQSQAGYHLVEWSIESYVRYEMFVAMFHGNENCVWSLAPRPLGL